jgi:hypothetical protein
MFTTFSSNVSVPKGGQESLPDAAQQGNACRTGDRDRYITKLWRGEAEDVAEYRASATPLSQPLDRELLLTDPRARTPHGAIYTFRPCAMSSRHLWPQSFALPLAASLGLSPYMPSGNAERFQTWWGMTGAAMTATGDHSLPLLCCPDCDQWGCFPRTQNQRPPGYGLHLSWKLLSSNSRAQSGPRLLRRQVALWALRSVDRLREVA